MQFSENIRFLMVSSLTYLTLAHFTLAQAQIVPDNTLGTESSVVKPDTIKGIPSDRIDGGAIRGANLFHSFSEFNIDSARGAYFTNPSGIENILTRVTGNNASQILGTLGVLGNANLFLINPNGIIFGKNAVLDIRGSFTATTADGIRFGENGLFSATNPQSSNLLTVKPGALFSNALSNQQATINNQGNLTVDAGKNINLLAANVINTGTLTAPEGIVQLTGTEKLITRGNIATATLFLNTKNLTIDENNNATVDKTTLESLSGNTNLILQGTNDITVDALTNSTLNLADGSGKIAFIADADRDSIGNFQMDTADNIKTNGRNVEITGVNLTVGNIDSSDKFGGGNIRLTATGGDITTQNLDSFSDSGSGNVISGDALAIGFGGAIAPLGESMSVNTISSNAHVNGGSIYIDASGDITSEKIRSYISNSSDNNIDKSGGDISLVSGGKVLINSGLRSDSYEVTNGNAGDIFIKAESDITINPNNQYLEFGSVNASTFASSLDNHIGNSGNIQLTSLNGNITVNGGIYTNSTNYSSGNAGNGGAISLTSVGSITTGELNSSSKSNSGNVGSGGAIALTTTQGDISTQNFNSSSNSDSGNAGDGGAIALSTTQGNISTQNFNSSSFSFSGNAGSGGAIALSTSQGNISTQNLASFSVSFIGNAGSGGAIALTTSQGNIFTQLLASVSFSVTGNAGSGGAIALTTSQGNIFIQYLDSSSISFTGNAGDGGLITLNARDGNINDDVDQNINVAILNSFSVSQTGNSGKGGNITLAAKNQITNLDILTLSTADKSGDVQVNGFGDLSLTNTNIITSKQVAIQNPISSSDTIDPANKITLDVGGVGQSGNVNISSTGNLTFQDSRIESDTKGDNPAGNVTITSPGAVTFNNSKIVSNTSNIGRAGNIQINANNLTLTDSSQISASTTAEGFAGDITLNSPTVTLANGGKIFATTTGNGNGGTITVNAPNLVSLGIGVQDFAPILTVETSGAGKAGDIIVNTPSLTVSDTARITATATATATNTKGGGSITLTASKLDLAGIVGIFAETQGQAPAGTLKLNPYANQPNLDITLFPNSNISASTSGSGKGGDLILTAPENINITGNGKLAVESTGIGDAGNIQITTQNLNINDGVKISASTMNGQGGNININAHTLSANNGGQFLTTTSGTAKAGNINVQVRDNITLDGTNTGLFANTEKGATGDSGNITIDPEMFIIKNGAGIGVNSNGSGKGGNISLQAGTLILDNQAFINAATTSNNGGEITLDIQDFLFVRRNSNITATAGTDFAGGNGGNITINSPFIIAIAEENSDITANAFSGQGGNINISTQGIFGIGFQAQQTAQSGITASSELGISGNVTINTPEVDPSKGLVQLSANLVDASRQIDNSCQAGSKQSASSFTITGRGGLPFNPYEYLQTDSVVKKWVTVDNNQTSPANSQSSINENPSPQEIVEAQGLIKGENGDIYLVAQASQVIPHSPTLTAATCASSR